MSWILPNAMENHDLMMPAWYLPHRLSPFPPSRPELKDDEDEEGIKASIEYIVSLIDEQVGRGVPEKRIVLGGFSQGHVMSLLVGLLSAKYSGKLGGLVGLSGYLPLVDRIDGMRRDAGMPAKMDGDMDVFIARGTKDRLVPKRYLSICSNTLQEIGVMPEKLTVKEYEDMAHVMNREELVDLCQWLEKVVPLEKES
jgi:predicted esterase